ncbi:hypothetical protein HJC23_005102 [Cyclotella cryptica]|uniref:Uncharacterized protein n=1 Tax=Cyclotella cryptica TaxID=29204 RepID=A0ABD3QEZ2_9STRA
MARNCTKRRSYNEESEEIGDWTSPEKKRKINMDDSSLSDAESPVGDVSNAAVSTLSVVGSADVGTLVEYDGTNLVAERPTTDTHLSDAILRPTETSIEKCSIIHAMVEQFQQRLESRGLDRQTSLERGATLEIRLILFQCCESSFRSMFFESHLQAERHHQERMDAPMLERIRRHRGQFISLLFNPIYFILAFAFRHSWLQSFIISYSSTVFPSCKVPSKEVLNLFYALRLGSAITLMYKGAQSADIFWCVAEITFFVFIICVGALVYSIYLWIPPNIRQVLRFAILVLIMSNSLVLFATVMIVNLLVMLLVLWASDATGMRLNVADREIHYENCMFIGMVLLGCSSIGVGHCFSY